METFFEQQVFQLRLRDGRTIYCDDDNRWWISQGALYYDSLNELLTAYGLIEEEAE